MKDEGYQVESTRLTLVDLRSANIMQDNVHDSDKYNNNQVEQCWIENWLSNRKQGVILNGCFLEQRDVQSGVPQGSVFRSSSVCDLYK